MSFLSIIIILFLILESLNVILLYFSPGAHQGNALGVFKAYEKSKCDPEVHRLDRYLVNWVAGTKLIFIALLIVILIMGSEIMKVYAILALVISIYVFYWRLYPAIKRMDQDGEITPKGYSRTLGIMIGVFLSIFCIALIVYHILTHAA